MVITYIVFGKETSNYTQAIFSMLTFLPQLNSEDSIAVVTEFPENFNALKNSVSIFEVDEQKLKNWKGKYNFFWRIKIKALQFVASNFSGQHIVYLDADTFLFGDINKLKASLNDGKNLMHKNEGLLSELHSKTEQLMWKQVKNLNFGGIKITTASCMWNAGVVAIAQNNIQNLTLALNICDEMCASKVTDRLIEQFALSIGLNNASQLLSAENEIGHYWGNKKEWNTKIMEFMAQGYVKNLSCNELIELANNFDFKSIPIRIRTPKTRERLIKKVYSIFPNKEYLYIH